MFLTISFSSSAAFQFQFPFRPTKRNIQQCGRPEAGGRQRTGRRRSRGADHNKTVEYASSRCQTSAANGDNNRAFYAPMQNRQTAQPTNNTPANADRPRPTVQPGAATVTNI